MGIIKNNLLDKKFIDFETIDLVLENRHYLKNEIINPPLSFFKGLKEIENPYLGNYYLGNSEILKDLISICDKNFTPLFPGDILEIKESNGKTYSLNSKIFLEHTLDGLSDIENLAISNEKLFFKLLSIEKIQLIKEDLTEVNNFFSKLDNISFDLALKESQDQVLFLINDIFLMKSNKLIPPINQETIIQLRNHILDKKFIGRVNPETFKKLECQLNYFLKTNNILDLLKCLYILYDN